MQRKQSKSGRKRAAQKARTARALSTAKKVFSRIPPGFLPQEKFLTMKISFEVVIAAVGTGTIGFNRINICSVYDPQGSGGARQYYGTSIMFQMYKYATILSSKFKLIAMAPNNDSNPFLLMARIQPENAADPNIDQASDFYEATYRTTPGVKMFGNYITKNGLNNNYIKGTYSAKRYFGNNSNIGGDPDYAATDTANPYQQCFLGIYSVLPPGTATTSGVQSFMFTCTSIVKWWGAKQVDND